MSTQRRNDFLRVGWSDEEESDRGYDSEAAEQSKGRAAKRRKLAQEEILDNEDEDNGDDDKVSRQETLTGIHLGQQTRSDKKDGFHDINSPSTQPSSTSKPKSKPLDKTPKKDKTGVIYLSSLPPYLKPSALKTLLHQRGFSPIARIFLTPAIPFSGGGAKRNKRKTYTDGWVEFASKKTAKICAETLNATIVGGRKGGWYHDDIWNIKYLRGFKWEDLMEQVQRERSEREARRRLEDARARKEDKVLLAGIEKGKVMEGIRKKREQKARKNADGLDGAEIPDFEVRRVFKQNEVRVKKEDPSALGENTKRILGKIF